MDSKQKQNKPLCNAFRIGVCSYGDKCKYAHVPCKYAKCTNPDCLFGHNVPKQSGFVTPKKNPTPKKTEHLYPGQEVNLKAMQHLTYIAALQREFCIISMSCQNEEQKQKKFKRLTASVVWLKTDFTPIVELYNTILETQKTIEKNNDKLLAKFDINTLLRTDQEVSDQLGDLETDDLESVKSS